MSHNVALISSYGSFHCVINRQEVRISIKAVVAAEDHRISLY